MWTAIQTAGAVTLRPARSGKSGRIWRHPLVLSTLGAAAVLMLAFQIGQLRYRDGVSRLVSASNVKGTGTSGRIYEADDPWGWGMPVHPVGGYEWGGEASTNAGGFQEWQASARGRSGGAIATGAPPSPESPAPAAGKTRRAESSISQQDKEKLASLGYLGRPPIPQKASVWIIEGRDSDEVQQLRPNAGFAEKAAETETYGIEALQPPSETGQAEPLGRSPSPRSSPVRDDLKIIRTGELTLQVAAYEGAVEAIERTITEKGGFIADAGTREEAGGALVGRIVVRVTPEQFEATFAALKKIGRVESENVKAADVTAEYVDLEARIKGLQITEERLRELIANKSFVDKIQSLLEVEREMNRVRTEIEQLQGQLRVMADRVALSTIIVTVREASRNVPTASLSVEVVTLDEAADALGEMLAKTGGRLVSGKTSKRTDGTLVGNYQLETTLARFAEVVSGIEALGRVEERQVKDQQFTEAKESWADSVRCSIALVLFERSRQLPSGSLQLEVDSLEEAIKRLDETLARYGAAIASNQTARQSNGSNAANIQLRVPAGAVGELVESLAMIGRMTAKTIAGEVGAIVGGAAAVPCTISLTLAEKPREVPGGTMTIEVAAFETARQALSKAIAERRIQVLHSTSSQRGDGTWTSQFRLGVPGKDMEAFVSQLEGLGRMVSRQISGLGLGDLTRIDPNALGTIDLALAEKAALAPAPDQRTDSIRARVREGLSGFYESIGLIAYGLVVLFPWLILTTLVGWLTLRIGRAIRARKAASGA